MTEQAIQRPQDKKKWNLRKEKSEQILSVSKSHKGRIHDFRIRKQEKLLPIDSKEYANSRYQRWQKLQSNAVIPYKKYCKKQLILEQKKHNRRLA